MEDNVHLKALWKMGIHAPEQLNKTHRYARLAQSGAVVALVLALLSAVTLLSLALTLSLLGVFIMSMLFRREFMERVTPAIGHQYKGLDKELEAQCRQYIEAVEAQGRDWLSVKETRLLKEAQLNLEAMKATEQRRAQIMGASSRSSTA